MLIVYVYIIMLNTPKANRLHISFFGKTNVGKSSLVNALTNQSICLVSNIAGTTTDPVMKAMELSPLGPVVIIDTAGLDDNSILGELRIKKSKEVIEKTDLAILVISPIIENDNLKFENFSLEKIWISEFKKRDIPVLGVVNKIDNYHHENKILKNKLLEQLDIPIICTSISRKKSIELLKESISNYAPCNFESPTIVGDIISPGSLVVLVAPQDIQAPKGRLILPQVQIIRDLLENNAIVVTVKDSELISSLNALNTKPNLVITDSQKFKYVNNALPRNIPLTSFSILMSRYKGDLSLFIEGVNAIDSLKSGDKVLIAEACTHHALKGDIAKEQLPKLLKDKIKNIEIVNISGCDFPDNLKEFKLIIHCGSCMFTKKQLMNRIIKAKTANIPITNFGIALSYLNNILTRTIEIFPEFKEVH